jgi:polysaccharide deacetylase 2 family uncharacterized protein YibQ
MRRDELRQPLRKRSLGERLWARRPGLLAVATVTSLAALAGGGFWLSRIPHPLAGEPVVTLAIPPAEDLQTASTDPVLGEAPEETAPSEEVQQEKEEITVEVEPPVEQDTYQKDAAIIVSPRRALKPAPIAGLVELASTGSLPKISAQGKKPADAYARTTPMGVIHSDAPKIAIILGGMGLNTALTRKASKELPADVTFAFAPYGNDLQSQVNKARAEGHEVMLQVPLEPVGFPANNPGPHTLLADAGETENIESLHWHMTRFTGYTGLTNYMGGRFLASPNALKPLMAEVRRRGLLFLEDGALPLTATPTAAKAANVPMRRAQVVIDADPSPQSIAAQLELLEGEARTNGIAIGTGAGLDVTIDTIKQWAEGARERGIVLVPVSAAYKGRKT